MLSVAFEQYLAEGIKRHPKRVRRMVHKQERTSLALREWMNALLGTNYDFDAFRHSSESICKRVLAQPAFLNPQVEFAAGGLKGDLKEENRCIGRGSRQGSTFVQEWYASRIKRDWTHERNNLGQEVALCEHCALAWKLYLDRSGPEHLGCGSGACCFPNLDAVVDVGGGNGILCDALSARLRCEGVVVDCYVPGGRVDRDTVDPTTIPYFRRVVNDLAKFNWTEEVVHRPQRTCLVAKHLCGSGIDVTLRNLESQSALPSAMVLATCCHFKGQRSLYLNSEYLEKVLHIHTDAQWIDFTSRTAWLQAEKTEWMRTCGAAVELLLDWGRVLWLRQRGYECRLVEFVENSETLRSKALFAVKRDRNYYLPPPPTPIA
jgi:hypothetical protein